MFYVNSLVTDGKHEGVKICVILHFFKAVSKLEFFLLIEVAKP